jgi:serpin B
MKPSLGFMAFTLMAASAGPATARDKGVPAGDVAIAARAINTLGLELLRTALPPEGNAVLSPYSIQLASAMTYAGADGKTREEMATTLHYPGEESLVHGSFAAMTKALEAVARRTAERTQPVQLERNRPGDPITLTVANRLYGQTGHAFRQPFLALLKDTYQAPFAPVDFVKNADRVAREINEWVAERTRQRIRDLIPAGTLDRLTRLVLVNAIYFKAPWKNVFVAGATKPLPFWVAGQESVAVPTMTARANFGYQKHTEFSVVTLPYSDPDLQLLIVLPEKGVSLRDLERRLTSARLAELGQAPSARLVLYLPKFKLEPDTLELGGSLASLGMKSAFEPQEADFRRMDSQRDLYVSHVVHKAFLAVDEQGTEAAAATAYAMSMISLTREPPAEPVRVDHPFFFAIQHRPSGACLFLGRVTDPR